MEIVLGLLLAGFIVYFIFEKLSKKKDVEEISVPKSEKLPYRVNDNFLTDTERSFYNSLKLYVGEKVIVCPKVGLKDFFFIDKGVGKDYMKYFNKIAKKHVDFLLCDPITMKPLCGIELDDISHTSKKTYNRDLFVERIYRDANFELIRISAKSGYTNTEIETALNGIINKSQGISTEQKTPTDQETMLCPKCKIPMVLRKATKGQNAGKEFYGCVNYPNCKELISKD